MGSNAGGLACCRFGGQWDKLVCATLASRSKSTGAFVTDRQASARRVVEAYDIIGHIGLGFIP